MVTRTYAAWGPAGVNQVAFVHPNTNSSALSYHSIRLIDDFDLENSKHSDSPNCKPADSLDTQPGIVTVQAALVLAETYASEAEAKTDEISSAFTAAKQVSDEIEDHAETARIHAEAAEAATDQCRNNFEQALNTSGISILGALYTSTIEKRDVALKAGIAAFDAHTAAVALNSEDFANAVDIVESYRISNVTL